MALTEKAKVVKLSDYKPSAFEVPTVALHFDLRDEEHVHVTNRSHFVRSTQPGAAPFDGELVLDGSASHLKLTAIRIDGKPLDAGQYSVDEKTGALTLHGVPEDFTLEVENDLNPKENKSNEGLYTSEGMFITQCETESYRNITYGLDRPDVLSVFDVTIDADKETLPYLLSNGKQVEATDLADGRHRARWVDNRPKPAYLFALGAGDFDVVKGDYTYPDGDTVELGYYVNKGNADKVTFALECIKNTLQHEYERWGHKYHSDSGVFNTIAVDAFNFGAMENTGLNIFNSQLMLANPKTATDNDFFEIDSVVNHEFCHDESGNWGIPRNWFQISFKEGLTVFRDKTYGKDTYGETASRITDVQELRARVFAYDSGAMTHPMVLPSYEAVMNNYDALTYPKAAEVNHMAQVLMGKDAYREAYRSFFDSTTPKLASTEEYFRHLAQHSGKNLDQFIDTWLNQPGVPTLEVAGTYDPEAKTYALTVKQILPKEASTSLRKAKPFHLPFACGLVDADGQDIPLISADPSQPVREDGVLEISKLQQTFTFKNIEAAPRLSLNRDSSAYAKVEYAKGCAPTRQDLAFLAIHDSNQFKRWDALQELAIGVMSDVLAAKKAGQTPVVDPLLAEALGAVLVDDTMDNGLKQKMLTLPSQTYLKNLQLKGTIDPIAIAETQELIQREIAMQLEHLFLDTYRNNQSSEPYTFSPEEMERRGLMNKCLGYLSLTTAGHTRLVKEQFDTTDNFNDRDAALSILADSPDRAVRQQALDAVYEEYKYDKLVMNRWFEVQALANGTTIDDIARLAELKEFDQANPNKVRSLIARFTSNPKAYHAVDGSGYAFIADWIIKMDAINEQNASRIVTAAFSTIGDYEPWRQKLMLAQVERIREARGSDLSPSVGEVVNKVLEQAKGNGISL